MEEKNYISEDVNTEEEITEKNKKKSAKKEMIEWIQAIVIAVVLALIVRSFIFTVVRVDGQSMEPTLQHNNRMIVWRLGYEPKQGDIVIFNPPGYDKKIFWVKRVIATEGQKVEIEYATNSVYVDGQKLDEPYLGEVMQNMNTLTEIDVPKDCVFLLGDNRNHSTDGRIIGPVNKDCIIGEAVLRFWPFTEINIF